MGETSGWFPAPGHWGVRNEDQVFVGVWKWKQSYLRWSDLDEEAAAFVGHFEDFGPGEAVDPQLVFVNHQTTGADAQHDVHTVQILRHRGESLHCTQLQT